MMEDEMFGWHHQLNGHEFEQTPGDGVGQGSLVCCSSWGCKELDTTERLNTNSSPISVSLLKYRFRQFSLIFLFLKIFKNLFKRDY